MMKAKKCSKQFGDAVFERAAEIFASLSDASRLAVLRRVMEGEVYVGEVARCLGFKQPTVSKHLSILQAAGLVHSRREASKMFYSVADPMVMDLCTLVCGSIQKRAKADARRLAG